MEKTGEVGEKILARKIGMKNSTEKKMMKDLRNLMKFLKSYATLPLSMGETSRPA